MHKITSFVVAEINKAKRGKELPSLPPVKSAPHYFEKIFPNQFILGQEKVKIGGKEIEVSLKTYHPDALVVEASSEVPDIFSDATIEIKDQLLRACLDLAKKNGAKIDTSEEFSIYQISGYEGDPEQFLEKYSPKIASLLKSEKLELDEQEIKYTLASSFKYAKDDLAIIDWDGAFIFDPKGDFGEILELLELANYQLLRYRALSEDLDERLRKTSKLINPEPKRRWFSLGNKEVVQAFKEVIRIRSESISQFETLERDIKLIGEWYMGRVYELASKKFRLNDWRQAVKDKLESLEDIYTIAAENLGMSRIQALEYIQIMAFFVLQIGWFIIIILEFFYYSK